MDRVDPSVRVSRMNEDLLILLEPRVHLIPEKGEVALQCGSIISRFSVSAGCRVGRSPRFIAEENVLAVGDQLATKVCPHPARATFDVYSLLQTGPLLGGW